MNAAVLEDLDRLGKALIMGIDRLERWAAFRRAAADDSMQDVNADPAVVADALNSMAAEMEKQPNYFDSELPMTFRFLAEANKDPFGATRYVVFGSVKSAENLFIFLAQRALGIGKKAIDGVEQHISKGVAAGLITLFSSAILTLSGALPTGWAWLKALLVALSVGGT